MGVTEGVECGASQWVIRWSSHWDKQQSSSQWETQLVSHWVISQCVLEHGGVGFLYRMDRSSHSHHPEITWTSGGLEKPVITILVF